MKILIFSYFLSFLSTLFYYFLLGVRQRLNLSIGEPVFLWAKKPLVRFSCYPPQQITTNFYLLVNVARQAC